jgi:hypothetical protein
VSSPLKEAGICKYDLSVADSRRIVDVIVFDDEITFYALCKVARTILVATWNHIRIFGLETRIELQYEELPDRDREI